MAQLAGDSQVPLKQLSSMVSLVNRRHTCLTFDDGLSASGKLVLCHIEFHGEGYEGFSNSRRHTWRVWNSMTFRLLEEDGLGQVMFDWMSGDWQARGTETAILLPTDSMVHNWSFRHEPEAETDPTWHDEALKRYVTDRSGNGQSRELVGEVPYPHKRAGRRY